MTFKLVRIFSIILIIAANLSFKERRGGRITAMSAPEVDFVEELTQADKPDEGSWAAQSSAPIPDFELSDVVSVDEDVHIDVELPPDGTMTKDMFEPKELETWVSDKYGEESAMDPKKEVDLQWLIDKKRKKNA